MKPRTPIKVKTHRDCEYKPCGKNFRKRKTTDKYCSSKCHIADNGYPEKKPQKKIPQFSEKRSKENAKYLKINREFLAQPENQICPVTGKPTTEVHHTRGRSKDTYYDDWARENRISLLLDKRWFLAVSHEGHREIEENPTWAKEKGFSFDRLQK